MSSPWDFSDENRRVESCRVAGIELKAGDRVRLAPSGRADIMDLALAGKIGQIEAIEQDFNDKIHLAIVLDDDPGRDLGMLRQPGHRFFFALDEVEPLPKPHPIDN
ncbi:MAG TPA: hypothetical protein VHX65_17305 [Pirellulales bacterium]|jgi:hypothetical protein|nr:hypothetical protein [Pirellulales bacterium]